MKTILLIDLAAGVAADAHLFADTAQIGTEGAYVDLGTDLFRAPEGCRYFGGEGAIGWAWDGARLVAPPAPPPDPDVVRALVSAEMGRRILAVASPEQQASMARYGIRLAFRAAALTPEERADADMLGALDLWEAAMLARRDELIAAGDPAAAMADDAWPTPPEGATAFVAEC